MHTSLFLFCSLSTLVQPLPFVAMLPWPQNAAQAGTSRLPTPGQATDGSCQALHASSVHICAVCVCILCRECGVLDLNGTSATSTQYSLYSCRFACSTLQLFSDCTEVSTSCSGWNTLTLLCPAWSKSKQTITRGTLRCVQFLAWVLTRAWSWNCGNLIAWPIFTWFISLHLPLIKKYSFANQKRISADVSFLRWRSSCWIRTWWILIQSMLTHDTTFAASRTTLRVPAAQQPVVQRIWMTASSSCGTHGCTRRRGIVEVVKGTQPWKHTNTRCLPQDSGRSGWSKQSDRKPTMMIYYTVYCQIWNVECWERCDIEIVCVCIYKILYIESYPITVSIMNQKSSWTKDVWRAEQKWLEKKLKSSTADWQIAPLLKTDMLDTNGYKWIQQIRLHDGSPVFCPDAKSSNWS